MKKILYFDHAAATPMDKRVLRVMEPYFTDKFYNPSALYLEARDVKNDLDTARSKVAHWLGARPSEIVFTAGGTEANNLAIRGIMEYYPGSEVIVSEVEHDSVLKPASDYRRKLIPVLPDGSVDLNALTKSLSDKTVLVSVMYANNEVGTIQPLKDIAKLIAKVRKDRLASGNDLPIYFHSDAAQAGNYLDLHVSRLGLDLMTLNGGKLYGPKQSGALFIKGSVNLKPQILGGEQEQGRRSGTENVAGNLGFAASLEIAQNLRNTESKRLSSIQKIFFSELTRQVPSVVINGSMHRRLPDNVHFSIPGQDNERLLIKLEQAGIYASAGSACAVSSDEPSHVLKAMGVPENLCRSSFRFTMGRSTKVADVRAVSKKIAALLE